MPTDALVWKVAAQLRKNWTAAGVQAYEHDGADAWAYSAISTCEQAGLVVLDPGTITAQETIAAALDVHAYVAPGICKCGVRTETWADTRAHRADSILEALRHA